VVDPSGQSQVEDIVTVGRGPYAVVGAKDQKLLFVSNVLEDTIAVIDIDPVSATHNRVVLRIGTPREP
jgi:DNA-binding beta-propeller fold protein YncE